MIKFDLEKALAGEKVITRDGLEVTQLVNFEGVGDRCESIYAMVGGKVISYYGCGNYTGNHSPLDLFMAPKKLSGFINVYADGDVGYLMHDTKEGAVFGRSKYQTVIACIDLSQFEEGHGL